MKYYLNKVLKKKSFEEAIEKVTEELKKEGLGILTEIDMKEAFKNKIGVDFKKYKIFGACNPHFAHKALQSEDKIGIFLPCNVVVEEHESGVVEVSIVNPVAAMSAVENEAVATIAAEMQQKLKRVVDGL